MNVSEQLSRAMQLPFGKVLADKMAIIEFSDGTWSNHRVQPLAPLSLSPAAHVFHYASACFEGLKVHRWKDGSIHAFRLGSHLKRLQNSANLLCLPLPPLETCRAMITEVVQACRDWVPDNPGTLYIRPTLIGTEPSIGSASSPSKDALFYVLVSPVGDYFKGGLRPLRIAVDTSHWRTSPEFGRAKAGANYSAALKMIQQAKSQMGVDQVLFAPNDDVQETGAANFLLINDDSILTKPLDTTFLHGITRDSLLTLAPDIGYQVLEEKITLDRLWNWVGQGEAALSGTAAVLAPIGTLLRDGQAVTVGDGGVGANTMKLRQALLNIQKGESPDRYHWLERL